MDAIPSLSADLISQLEEEFPSITAAEILSLKQNDNDIELIRRAAQRQLVERLLHIQEEQKQEDLT